MRALLSPASGVVSRCLSLLLLCGVLAAPQAVSAQATEAARLAEVMRLGEIVAVMRTEGISYASSLDEELLAGRGGDEWTRRIETIYDEARMNAVFSRNFAPMLEGQEAAVAAALEFFGSDLGQRILSLEITAREAMLDEGIDEAAREAGARMIAGQGPRHALIVEFIAVNDLLETNIVGALNASLAFYSAFVAAGGINFDMPEQDIMADVWSSEPEIRAETQDWLYAFLGMAYAPLSAEELAAYTAYSATPEGQVLNRALFAGFDAMFIQLSSELGQAAGERLAAQDL